MTKVFRQIVLPLLLLTVLLGVSGCGETAPESLPSEASPLSHVYTMSPADLQTEHPEAQNITLKENEVYSITQAGAYRLTGEQTGQIRIDVQDEIVHLILDNAALKSYNGPAIYVKTAAKLVLTLPEGTVSSLTDSSYYEEQPAQDACIFSNADLTINGTGTLNVTGNYADGIRTKDVLKIRKASVTVRAKGHGLRGADGVALEDAQADLQCEGSGIYTSKENKPGRGFAAVSGGSLTIIGGEYGMQVAENVYIQTCKASIYGVLGNIDCQGERHIQEGCLQ